MNPSSNGWLKKTLHQLKDSDLKFDSSADFYDQIQKTGFIYGANISCILPQFHSKNFTHIDFAKLNLLLSLLIIFKEKESSGFLDSIFDFYTHLGYKNKRSFFKLTKAEKTEALLNKRIYTFHMALKGKMNFYYLHLFLFWDILNYAHFLNKTDEKHKNTSLFQQNINTLIFKSSTFYSEDSLPNQKIIHLIKTYSDITPPQIKYAAHTPLRFQNKLEKLYALDILHLIYQPKESAVPMLIDSLSKILLLDTVEVQKSFNGYYFFQNKNPLLLKQIHAPNAFTQAIQHSYKLVKGIVLKNKKRILTELYESRELLQLLKKSAHENLSEKESEKVKAQSMDLIKSIPSLAIFLLPGGSLLLPVFIKLLPQLLPSSFNENKIKEKETKV